MDGSVLCHFGKNKAYSTGIVYDKAEGKHGHNVKYLSHEIKYVRSNLKKTRQFAMTIRFFSVHVHKAISE